MNHAATIMPTTKGLYFIQYFFGQRFCRTHGKSPLATLLWETTKTKISVKSAAAQFINSASIICTHFNPLSSRPKSPDIWKHFHAKPRTTTDRAMLSGTSPKHKIFHTIVRLANDRIKLLIK